MDNRVEQMVLFAWVGEDEYGSGEVGLKQGRTPCGLIPLVACKDGKLDQDYILQQMKMQSRVFGKTIRLAKFVFSSVEIEIDPDGKIERPPHSGRPEPN